jgi:hypothetical protein
MSDFDDDDDKIPEYVLEENMKLAKKCENDARSRQKDLEKKTIDASLYLNVFLLKRGQESPLTLVCGMNRPH